jgi:hypothetical protein
MRAAPPLPGANLEGLLAGRVVWPAPSGPVRGPAAPEHSPDKPLEVVSAEILVSARGPRPEQRGDEHQWGVVLD